MEMKTNIGQVFITTWLDCSVQTANQPLSSYGHQMKVPK